MRQKRRAGRLKIAPPRKINIVRKKNNDKLIAKVQTPIILAQFLKDRERRQVAYGRGEDRTATRIPTENFGFGRCGLCRPKSALKRLRGKLPSTCNPYD